MKAYRDAVHIVLDIETLGLELDCPIIQVGAVEVEKIDEKFRITNKFARTISIDSNIASEFTNFSDKTINFWNTYKDRLVAMFNRPVRPIRIVLDELRMFCTSRDTDYYWSKGNCFDFPILENAYNKLNISVPWKYYQVRDIRTIQDPLFREEGFYDFINTHDALEDCTNEAMILTEVLNKQTED